MPIVRAAHPKSLPLPRRHDNRHALRIPRHAPHRVLLLAIQFGAFDPQFCNLDVSVCLAGMSAPADKDGINDGFTGEAARELEMHPARELFARCRE